MKVSELIQELQTFLKKNGDVPVVIQADYAGPNIAIVRDDDENPPYTNIGFNKEWYGSSVICAIEQDMTL